MSRFLESFIYSGLKDLGQPRPKGIFRRPHVDSLVCDAVVMHGLQLIVGLGAGRPEIAIRMLADTFEGNSWTKESTAGLMRTLQEAENIVATYSQMSPWDAMWHQHRLASFSKDWRWSELFNDGIGMIRAMAASRAAYWGLTNEHRMPAIFDREKLSYQKRALEANQYGLGISNAYPFESLEQFYQSCDTFIHAFNMAMPPFGDIPSHLRAAPEIARRLSA